MANYISSYIIDYNDSKQLKYGVINLCDNTTYYGSTTWSVTNNGGLTGLTVGGSPVKGVTLSTNNSKYLVITNTYTGTASDPEITVKASSNLVSCDTNNTCKITLRRACQRQYVIFEVEINDDSKGYVSSVGGFNDLKYGKNSEEISSAGLVWLNDIGINYPKDSSGNIQTYKILGNCSITLDPGNKLYFDFNDISVKLSLKNNVQNIVVNGEVKYKFNDDNYTTLDSLSSDIYTYSSTSDYPINITGCNYKTTKLHDLMDGLKTLHIRHVINLKYDDVAATVVYKFYKHESALIEISSASETYIIDNNHTYSLNDIIRGGYYYACAESPTDNSVSATLFTISNFNSDNSYFTSSSLAINDNDGSPSGRFYIGVKCNTSDIVNLLNGTNSLSCKMTFNLSYKNASIPVTVNVNKDSGEWYKLNGSLSKITSLNIENELYLPESVTSEAIVFKNNNYITDISKYSYEQKEGDFNVNISFEKRNVNNLTVFGLLISAKDDEIDKLYKTSSIISLSNIKGNIICDEKYKLPISFKFKTPFRIHVLNFMHSSFPDIIDYIEMGLIETENSGNTSGIHELINTNKMHYNMYKYDIDTKYKYIFVDIHYHTNKISKATLQCKYPSESNKTVEKSYSTNNTGIDNLRITIPYTTNTKYYADFTFRFSILPK